MLRQTNIDRNLVKKIGRGSGPLFDIIKKGEVKGHTSSLSIMELNVGPYQRKEEHIALNYMAGLKIFPHFFIHDFSLNMADEAAKLRAKYKFETPDAIHVASAILSKCQVLLGNDKKFKKIDEISYLHLDDFVK